MKLRLKKYLELLGESNKDNLDKIKQIRSLLNIQYASIEKYIKEIGNNPAMNDGVNPGYYSVYQNAFSADIIQRVGPSSEAVLQDLDYIYGKLKSMQDKEFKDLFETREQETFIHEFSRETIEALSEFICGDDTSKFPEYRSSWYLTNFFRNIGINVEHDGSTRKIWVQGVLDNLKQNQIKQVVLRLVDIKEYKGDQAKLRLAIKAMDDILLMEGLEVKLVGIKPTLVSAESLVLEKGTFIDSAVQDISQVFPEELIKKLKNEFSKDLEGLALNFDKSGNGTAFFLRKILEKLIFIVFNKNGLGDRIQKEGKLLGLDAMINIASTEKINHLPILHPKTAQELKGLKFLGDTSAHNPLVNVDMKTIKPQLPYIITAFEELSKNI